MDGEWWGGGAWWCEEVSCVEQGMGCPLAVLSIHMRVLRGTCVAFSMMGVNMMCVGVVGVCPTGHVVCVANVRSFRRLRGQRLSVVT